MKSVDVTCDMVRDMLPLYIDGVLSEDSKTVIAEHLADCTECKQLAKEMEAEVEELGNLEDGEASLFKKVSKEFKKMYFLRAFLVVLVFVIVWIGAEVYITTVYRPIYPKAEVEYIDECLDIVMIDGAYYVHQDDMFAYGELVLLNCENGEVNFYLGEHGILSLGLAKSMMCVPKYQRLGNPEYLQEVTKVNYCKPDGTVIITLWEEGEELPVFETK